MRDGGHEIAAQLVEATLARDVLKNDRDSSDAPTFVVNRVGPRQERARAAHAFDLHGFVITGRRVGAFAA